MLNLRLHQRFAQLRQYGAEFDAAADLFFLANREAFDLQRLGPQIHLALIVSTPLMMIVATLLLFAAESTPERLLAALTLWLSIFVGGRYIMFLCSALRTIAQIRTEQASSKEE